MGVLGFEPRTSSLSGTRSNQLSYTPAIPQKVASLRPRGSGLLTASKVAGTFRGPRSPVFRAAALYSNLRVRYFSSISKVASLRPRRVAPAGRWSAVAPAGLSSLRDAIRSRNLLKSGYFGGAEGARTLDILLAKQVL